ncbi:MAG TPA: hypothetical protein VKU02_02150 [Gemmataceae bacterium]|nr:hypothetical protein [Gemmataceae bacterium]
MHRTGEPGMERPDAAQVSEQVVRRLTDCGRRQSLRRLHGRQHHDYRHE